MTVTKRTTRHVRAPDAEAARKDATRRVQRDGLVVWAAAVRRSKTPGWWTVEMVVGTSA